MAIKNKRTSIKSSNKVEERLKKQLKEDYSNFLEEDDEDLDIAGAKDADDLGADPSGMGDSMGGNDLGDDENLDMDTDPNADPSLNGGGAEPELSQSQELEFDNQIDNLLTGLAGEGDSSNDDLNMDDEGLDDISDVNSEDDLDLVNEADEELPEEDNDLGMGDDSVEFPDEDSDDVSVETDSFEDDGSTDDSEGPLSSAPGDWDLEELNNAIGAKDTWDVIKNKIEAQILKSGDGSEDSEPAEELTEDASNNFPEAGDPMKGLKGEDKGGFDQGYEGKERKDELMEAGEPEGFKETSSKLQGKYSKTADGKSTAKKIDTTPTFSKVSQSQTFKESVKKSKMLVKAATAILKLKESNDKLKLENQKLARLNGIFAAVGEKLSKDVRKKMTEKFEGCKTETEVKALYEKVVKVIREKNKATLNEAVTKNKTQIKTAVKESAKVPDANKKALNEAQIRINHLMGLDKGEGYWKA